MHHFRGDQFDRYRKTYFLCSNCCIGSRAGHRLLRQADAVPLQQRIQFLAFEIGRIAGCRS